MIRKRKARVEIIEIIFDVFVLVVIKGEIRYVDSYFSTFLMIYLNFWHYNYYS